MRSINAIFLLIAFLACSMGWMRSIDAIPLAIYSTHWRHAPGIGHDRARRRECLLSFLAMLLSPLLLLLLLLLNEPKRGGWGCRSDSRRHGFVRDESILGAPGWRAVAAASALLLREATCVPRAAFRAPLAGCLSIRVRGGWEEGIVVW